MKKVICVFAAAMILLALCSCDVLLPQQAMKSVKPSAAATKTPKITPEKTETTTPEPGASLDMNDPLDQYTALAKKKDKEQISELVDSLLAAGDYQRAGEIVTREHKAGRSNPYDVLCNMFFGHEEAVDMTVWADRYRTAAKAASQKELEPQMSLMYSFHGILYKHNTSEKEAMGFAYGGLTYAFKDEKGALLAACGKNANGKALVYTKNGNEGSIDMCLTAALPEELLPLSTEEVEYIILLETKKVTVGRYSNGGAAQRQDITINLLQYPNGEIIKHYGTLRGGSPPSVITVIKGSMMGATGAKPAKDDVIPILVNAITFINSH